MSEYIFSGVLRALAVDAWWMSADAAFEVPEERIKERLVRAGRTR